MIQVQYPTLSEQQQIILKNFDFQKVHKVMQALEWTWFNSDSEDQVPSIGELVLHLQRLLSDASTGLLRSVITSGGTVDKQYMVGCGGFTVTANYWHEDDCYTIDAAFEVASWSTRD